SVGCLTEVLKKQKNNKGQKEYACIRHPYQDGWSERDCVTIKNFKIFRSQSGGRTPVVPRNWLHSDRFHCDLKSLVGISKSNFNCVSVSEAQPINAFS
ncbi:MAG: hypothetical protein ABSH41_27345, partial [Syntrophobacteraceae bacterium]